MHKEKKKRLKLAFKQKHPTTYVISKSSDESTIITDSYSDVYGVGDTIEDAWNDYSFAMAELCTHYLHTPDSKLYPNAIKKKYKLLKHFDIMGE